MFTALAASLLVAAGIGLWQIPNTQPKHETQFASVARMVEASWATGSELSAGQRISSQFVRLESGIVHLAFDSGVEVTLQGPVVFELTSADLTRLHSGILTCTVPSGAEGPDRSIQTRAGTEPAANGRRCFIERRPSYVDSEAGGIQPVQ